MPRGYVSALTALRPCVLLLRYELCHAKNMIQRSTQIDRFESSEMEERINRFNDVPMKRRDYVRLAIVLVLMLALFAVSAALVVWIAETYFWIPVKPS